MAVTRGVVPQLIRKQHKGLNRDISVIMSEIEGKKIDPGLFHSLFSEEYSKTSNTKHYFELIQRLGENTKFKDFLDKTLLICLEKVLHNVSQKDPARCAELIWAMYSYSKNKKIHDLLTSDVDFITATLITLKANNENVKEMFADLVTLSIKKYNASLLRALKQFNPSEFEAVLLLETSKTIQTESSSLIMEDKHGIGGKTEDKDSGKTEDKDGIGLSSRDNADTDKDDINASAPKDINKIVETLLSFDEGDALEISQLLQEFFSGFGKVTYPGGLLTCAQIKERKETRQTDPYDFQATVLNGCSEFQEYVEILKKGPWPIRERFVIADAHWFAGEISIDANGKADLLMIDSLGEDSRFFPLDMLIMFDEAFPKNDIYFSFEKRQHAGVGCSAFSLDDLPHLFTLRFLADKFHDKGLFGFLKKNIIKTLTRSEQTNSGSKSVTFHICNLPLSLDRTMQSIGLFEETLKARSFEEQKLPVNKDNESAQESFQKSVRLNPDLNKEQNMRLIDKLIDMGEFNAAFVLKHKDDLASLRSKMHEFTLESFKQRMTLRRQENLSSGTPDISANQHTVFAKAPTPPASITITQQSTPELSLQNEDTPQIKRSLQE